MTVFGFIRQFLKLLATWLFWTAVNSATYYALTLMSLVTIRFLFQHKTSLKLKLKHILKHGLQQHSLYIKKEKSEPNFNILKSVLMNGMSHRYREWSNPVAYFCTETSKTGSKDLDESESNSEEGSSHDENEDSVKKDSKLGEIETEDSEACISSTKAVFEHFPASQKYQKRKAESSESENSKRSKSKNSLKIEVSKLTQEVTGVNIKTSSETRSDRMEGTSSTSDYRLTAVCDVSSKSDRTYVELPKNTKDTLLIKSETFSFSLPLRDKHVEDNAQDKSGKSDSSYSSGDVSSTMKTDLPVSQTKHAVTKSAQIETTKKFYPVPQKIWKNLEQDKSCNTPSDPRIRKKNMSGRKTRFGPSIIQENPNIRINKDNIPMGQSMASNNNTETTSAPKYSMPYTVSSQNKLEWNLIFPEINFSALLQEQSKHLESFGSPSLDASEKVPEVVRQFFKNVEKANTARKKSNENLSLGCSVFSSDVEKSPNDIAIKSKTFDGPGEASDDILPCCSTSGSEISQQGIDKVKIYPGLSLQPLKVKKDARYQKKFYKERKEIILPKKLGEVIQWAAKKPRDEVNIPASEVLPSDERSLPIDEYREKAQTLTESFMTMFDSAREQKAKHKLDKKNRQEEKERMKKENTGYIESSFKEESPSSESSSDSLPTSGDSPVKVHSPPPTRPKISQDYDISMVEVSPLKPVSNASPKFSSQSESLSQSDLGALDIGHLSDDNVCEEPKTDSDILSKFSTLSVLIKFISENEVVSPKKAIFCRDTFGSKKESENERLKPFYRIENVAPVSCSPISVEEFLDELFKTQDTYYRTLYSEDRRLFRVFHNAMTICVIPLHRPQSPDGDYELDGDTLVKTERRTESEKNISQLAPGLDCILDLNMSQRENSGMVSESPSRAIRDRNLHDEVASQASNMHQSHGALAGDLSSSRNRDDWTLREIELYENKAPQKHPEKQFPTHGPGIRIESKMEEWPDDLNRAGAISIGKNVEKERPGPKLTNYSSDNTLPMLFGYPTPELLSRIVDNDPKWQCTAPSPVRRKTKSESSKYGSSNLLIIEPKKPQEETTAHDVSNQCQEKLTTSMFEKTTVKRSEMKTYSRRTEINPKPVTSERQESSSGHGVITKKGPVNKDSEQSSSATGKNTESIQQTSDTTCKLTSTPEKDALSSVDVIELSSDSENEDAEAIEEQSRK